MREFTFFLFQDSTGKFCVRKSLRANAWSNRRKDGRTASICSGVVRKVAECLRLRYSFRKCESRLVPEWFVNGKYSIRPFPAASLLVKGTRKLSPVASPQADVLLRGLGHFPGRQAGESLFQKDLSSIGAAMTRKEPSAFIGKSRHYTKKAVPDGDCLFSIRI